MEQQQRSSYRQVFKATSLFGGVQVFNILIGIVRSKFIAVLLGPTGMGVAGLLTSTTGMVSALTNFGLSTSAVRNVAEASSGNEGQRIAIVVTTLRKLVWITGMLGTLITLLFAPWLSELTFGNKDYTYAFMFLSVTLLFSQLSAGQNVILQGTRKLRYMAKAGLLGSLSGLFMTVPLYYFLGMKGIVPAIIISSIVSLLLSWYFARKVIINSVPISFSDVWKEGKGMLTLGFMLNLSGLISLSVSYLVRVYIGREGGVDQVGFYNAGFAIINTYVGLIFTAMAADYFPRLSGVAHSNSLATETINHQAEIAILILAPILMVFFVFIHWIVFLLYSERFVPVNGMIQWAALGMFFRAASWAVAFLFLAKGASRVYFVNELVINIVSLILNILFYSLWGLDGLGIAFLLIYIVYFVQVLFVCNRLYHFNYSRGFLKNFLIQLIAAIVCLSVVKCVRSPLLYGIGALLIIFSCCYSLIELDKRLDIKSLFLRKK